MESVVKHTPGTYYLELRQDYITLCMSLTYRKEKSKSSPHCKALILSIMEKWTNYKISKGKDPHISMTYPQWIDETYGLFARNAIIDSLDELTHEGLLQREAFKSPRGGRDQYKYLLEVETLNKKLNPTFTNQPCEEEQSRKVNDQGLQVNVATFKNKHCSSSPTFKSKPFIESDTQNQSIKLEKKEDPPQSFETTIRKRDKSNQLPAILKNMVDATTNKFHEYDRKDENREAIGKIYQCAKERQPDAEDFDFTFRMAFESARDEAMGMEDKSTYLLEALCRQLGVRYLPMELTTVS